MYINFKKKEGVPACKFSSSWEIPRYVDSNNYATFLIAIDY